MKWFVPSSWLLLSFAGAALGTACGTTADGGDSQGGASAVSGGSGGSATSSGGSTSGGAGTGGFVNTGGTIVASTGGSAGVPHTGGSAGNTAMSGAGGGGAPSTVGGAGAGNAGALNTGGAVGTGGSPNTGGSGQSAGKSSSGGSTPGGASAGGAGKGGASGGAGGALGGAAGSLGSAGKGGDTSAVCTRVRTDYAAELQKQISCDPRASRTQCAGRVAAGAGCECQVFVEAKDPLAIEHLGDANDEWFTANCTSPVCPATCPTANRGVCQADPQIALGGRCVAAP